MNDHISIYKTDTLFLLVGTNPLPNYITALLLAKNDSTIILLHSSGIRGTGTIAANLKSAINKRMPQVQIVPREIDERDGSRIARKITEVLKEINLQSPIGLSYTGGTKAMAVHVYLTIRRATQLALFSYLDARTLSLLIEKEDDSPTRVIPVGDLCNVQLKEILSLHGYYHYKIQRNPVQPDFCSALAGIHSERDSYDEWSRWLKESNFESLPSKSEYPLLENVINVIDTLCNGKPLSDLLAQKLGKNKLINCKDFLEGKWLEQYTFYSLQQIAGEFGLRDIGFNLEIDSPRHFELDVVFVRGYQLFALSCKRSMNPTNCKLALFEAYVRARQIGGDEARIGLVCCYERPDQLQREVEEAWFTEGRVKVFGMRDLPDLPAKLGDWIANANYIMEGGSL